LSRFLTESLTMTLDIQPAQQACSGTCANCHRAADAESALIIDETLLARFGGLGPRYTSYPTADRFHEGVTEAAYANALRERRQRSEEPLGLYVHIPFCRTICYYCACNKIGTKRVEHAQPYVESLFTEIDRVCHELGERQRVSHLHLGGGTPTFLPDELMAVLIRRLRDRFEFADEGEYSIEVDPRTVDPQRIVTLRSLGLNRISLGVQDFDEQVQRAVNRLQPWDKTRDLIHAARKVEFASINVDLIYGLPRQTPLTFEATVDRTIELGPDRIALYHYAHLPHLFKPQRRIDEVSLPASADKARMFEHAVRRFEAAGYVHLGLDHFAKADDELAAAQRQGRLHRNFQGYCSHDSGDLIGFGVSAISSVGRVYAQNDKTLPGWHTAVSDGRLPVMRGIELDDDDLLRRAAIQALMCNFALSWDRVEHDFGAQACDRLRQAASGLADLRNAGAVTVDRQGVRVLARGRLLVRAVAMAFDRYLNQDGAGTRYSRIA
jgi:oxygen-independent coproporphyrinogen-3 oxidase